MRCGPLPVARATSGLADPVADGVDGYRFGPSSPEALEAAAARAHAAYGTPARDRAVQAAMAKALSWLARAQGYVGLCRRSRRLVPMGQPRWALRSGAHASAAWAGDRAKRRAGGKWKMPLTPLYVGRYRPVATTCR